MENNLATEVAEKEARARWMRDRAATTLVRARAEWPGDEAKAAREAAAALAWVYTAEKDAGANLAGEWEEVRAEAGAAVARAAAEAAAAEPTSEPTSGGRRKSKRRKSKRRKSKRRNSIKKH